MTVTLNIDNQRIRLVSQRGNRIELWQSLDLPPGVIKNGLILDPPAVAALLKERFQTFKLPAQQVRVCLTGLSFIYRVLNLPDLKATKLRSAVERATQKETALPLDNLYLDWQIIKRTDQELEIFVLGIARQMVDVLLITLKLAGLNLQSLELKALALARAVIHHNALVVDCESDAFEILIVQGGVPVTIHRVSPKNEMSTFEDNLFQMITELNRAIDYYNLNHPDNPLTRSTPVILSGSLCDEPAARRQIMEGIGHSVELIKSPLNLPANFPISTYAANLGLVYHSQDKTDSNSSAGINLIEARRRTLHHPIEIKKVVVSGAMAGALLLLILVWMAHRQTAIQSADLRLKAENLNQEVQSANQVLQQANQVQNQIAALNAQTRQMQNERQAITGKGELSSILESITGNLPIDLSISQISSQPIRITIDGSARTREAIVSYIHSLEKLGLFSEVRIALLEGGIDQSGPGYTFRIVIER